MSSVHEAKEPGNEYTVVTADMLKNAAVGRHFGNDADFIKVLMYMVSALKWVVLIMCFLFFMNGGLQVCIAIIIVYVAIFFIALYADSYATYILICWKETSMSAGDNTLKEHKYLYKKLKEVEMEYNPYRKQDLYNAILYLEDTNVNKERVPVRFLPVNADCRGYTDTFFQMF